MNTRLDDTRSKEERDNRPMIPLHYGRDVDGNIDKVKLVPFQPGMVLNRLGKKYVVDAKGTQRRVK